MAFADRRKIINSFGDDTDQRICLMPQHQAILTNEQQILKFVHQANYRLADHCHLIWKRSHQLFLWAVKSDQFDDSQGNAARILLDDE